MWRFKLGLFLLLSIVVPSFASELTVKNFSPQGEVKTARPAISVTFSEPVVSENAIGRDIEEQKNPLHFRPSLAGRAKWEAVDRLVFEPSVNLAPATRYDADFGPGGFRSTTGMLLAGPQSFSFYRSPLVLQGVTQVQLSSSNQATLQLQFNQAVSPVRLKGFVSILDDKGHNVGFSVRGQAPAKAPMLVADSTGSQRLVVTVAPGLTPDIGSLGLAERSRFTVDLSSVTRVVSSRAHVDDNGHGYVEIATNSPVDIKQVRGFLELTPRMPYTVMADGNGFSIRGDFAPRSRITVKLRKGLSGKNADGMKEDFVKAFLFPDRDASIRFPTAGLFLTPAEKPHVSIDTVNVDKLEIQAWRLYGNNFPLIYDKLDSYEVDANFERYGESLGSKKFLVDGAVNQTTHRAVDLTSLLGSRRGLYLVRAVDSFDGDTSAQMLVCITDVALSVRNYEKGLQLWAATISGAAPAGGGKVTVYSASNQLVASGVTDASGLLTVAKPDGWGKLPPALAVYEKDSELSFVSLSENQLNGRDLDVSGAPWPKAYTGMWAMPRNLWQPGETLEARAIVRTRELKLPGALPLKWTLKTAGSVTIGSGVLKLDEQGSAVIRADIPDTAPAGDYQLDLRVPDTDTSVALQKVRVEQFLPPQVEANLDLPATLIPGQDVPLSFNAKYLFGAAAAGLHYELSYATSAEEYKSKAYPGYKFSCEDKKLSGKYQDAIGEGSLDDNGRGSFKWTVPEEIDAPSILRARVQLNVMEASGRWTGVTKTVPVYPRPVLLGVMAPEGVIRTNNASPIRLIALNTSDVPIQAAAVKVTVNAVSERYMMVTENGRSRMAWQEEISELTTDTIDISGERTVWTFKPADEGQYLITFIGKDCRASVRLTAANNRSNALAGAAMPDRIDLKLDKASYKVGEIARLTVKSPFPGRLVVAVGSDSPLSIAAVDMKSERTDIDIPVTEALLPNGWCAVQVTRAEGPDTVPPYRALGAVPLKLDLNAARLDVQLTVPEKAEPGPVSVKLRVLDAAGRPINGRMSLALVDRGILLLSGFEGVNPWDSFTRIRQINGTLSDIYDNLRPIESRGLVPLHPAGGDSSARALANADMMSPVKAEDYKPLSLYFPDVEVKDGSAAVTAQVPEFSGSLRVEAVVLSGVNMGRNTAQCAIARPIVIETSLPRFAAPGDTFESPLRLISTLAGQASVSQTFVGPLSFGSGYQPERQITLKNGTQDLAAQTFKASAVSGNASLTTKVSVNGRTFSVQKGIAVRPSWPRISQLGGGRAAGGSTKVTIPGGWYPGTTRVQITMAGAPVTDISSLLDYLDSWGFWITRVVARGWVQLALPALMSGENGQLYSDNENRALLEGYIRKLAALQLYDGSWTSWPGGGNSDPWGSVAALHLLSAVKDSGQTEALGYERGLEWLRRYMAEPLSEDAGQLTRALDARAYGCYILAAMGQAPLGWMNWLEERIGDLSASGRALLAAAYAAGGNKARAESMIGSVAAGSGPKAKLNLSSAGYQLLALNAIAPGGAPARDLASAVSAELKKHHKDFIGDAPGSLVMALSVFAQHSGATAARATLIGPDGKQLVVFEGKPVTWTGADVGGFTFAVEGSGNVWYSYTVSGVPQTDQKPFTRGVKAALSFVDRQGEAVNPGRLVFGQSVMMKVRVDLTGSAGELRVSVLLPAGLEAENGGHSAEDVKNAYQVHADKRFDRVLLNLTGPGRCIEWLIPCRTVFRGTFVSPALSVEAAGNAGIGFLGVPQTVTVR